MWSEVLKGGTGELKPRLLLVKRQGCGSNSKVLIRQSNSGVSAQRWDRSVVDCIVLKRKWLYSSLVSNQGSIRIRRYLLQYYKQTVVNVLIDASSGVDGVPSCHCPLMRSHTPGSTYRDRLSPPRWTYQVPTQGRSYSWLQIGWHRISRLFLKLFFNKPEFCPRDLRLVPNNKC